MSADTSLRLSRQQARDQAERHEVRARALRAQAAVAGADAARHERWAARWRDWAEDEYGDVPYPTERSEK